MATLGLPRNGAIEPYVLTGEPIPLARRRSADFNGLQDHFVMVGGQQSARSLQHLAEPFRLADRARVLDDPDLAVTRTRRVLAVHGLA